ncbi:uncharacterized protein CC84DRAFT_1196889 [Paraphaeosphaeria sporulosa]|uniref:Aminoglycoside phosphotransferase domain-containing protein n=1 Tax=Paraphaeosphaeria sporulosa TaxID=1460663 RepID=A0A177CC32_9PLEO|nr:uncharacterized protein CC84DRAFT_1196889 [Paraphaeosphaeria sporulosa]OAG04876.1 hypothetical protein CC84DRAFT_1196889 [Paraphaeosphaeria sporulosa]
MAVERKYDNDHIKQSLKQINPESWLVGSLILRRLPYFSENAVWNDSDDNSSYELKQAPNLYDWTAMELDSPYITLIHEAGDASAVWSIGNNAFCKVKYIERGVTPESVTLNFVQEQRPSFRTPKVLHYFVDKDRSYLFLERLPGRTLAEAWPSLSMEWRRSYVSAVVRICKEMAEWEGKMLSGVDGQGIPEYYLQPRGVDDFTSLQETCATIGMDCSTFFFYHADLGPCNIIVEDEPERGTIGIIDFEIAGYFPRGWIRTKFRISSGMNLPPSSKQEDPLWWRRQVQMELGVDGFEDFTEEWQAWLAG